MAFIKKNILWLISIIVVGAMGLTFGLNVPVKSKAPEVRVVGNYAYTPSQVANVMNRTLNSSFQISDQRMGIVSYNVQITNSATVVLGNSGQIILETSPDNSTWTTISTSAASMGSGVLVTAISTATVFGFVPRGYYVRIRSNNVTGTPTYGAPSGVEILIN